MRTWVYSPHRVPKPKIPPALKQRVQEEGDRLIEEFRPRHVVQCVEEPRFNYISALYTKWYRGYFYLCATYTCPGPDALFPSFESPFTRLEYVGADRFNLAYMRYTGKWWEVFTDLSLEQALATIRDEPLFHPV